MAAETPETVPDGTVAPDDGSGAAPFTLTNYLLFAGGLLDIILGWFMLRAGHITLAPIMLIVGYCAIIPLAIVHRKKG